MMVFNNSSAELTFACRNFGALVESKNEIFQRNALSRILTSKKDKHGLVELADEMKRTIQEFLVRSYSLWKDMF